MPPENERPCRRQEIRNPLRPPKQLAPCPLQRCDGSGFIVGADDEARPCSCREHRRQERLGRQLGALAGPSPSLDVPPLSLLPSSTITALDEMSAALADPLAHPRGAWIAGEEGAVTSAACRLLASAASEGGHRVQLVQTLRLAWRLRARAAGEGEGAMLSFLYDELAQLDLLVLEDLDDLVRDRDEAVLMKKARGSQPERRLTPGFRELDIARICELISARYRDARPTIVSSSLLPEQLFDELQRLGRQDLVAELLDVLREGKVDEVAPRLAEVRATRLCQQLLDRAEVVELRSGSLELKQAA